MLSGILFKQEKEGGGGGEIENLVEQARFCMASKLGAIEVLVDGTEAGACRKLIGSLKSDLGAILNAMEASSKRQSVVLENKERSIAARDGSIKELKSKMQKIEEELENSLLSQVSYNLSLYVTITYYWLLITLQSSAHYSKALPFLLRSLAGRWVVIVAHRRRASRGCIAYDLPPFVTQFQRVWLRPSFSRCPVESIITFIRYIKQIYCGELYSCAKKESVNTNRLFIRKLLWYNVNCIKIKFGRSSLFFKKYMTNMSFER